MEETDLTVSEDAVLPNMKNKGKDVLTYHSQPKVKTNEEKMVFCNTFFFFSFLNIARVGHSIKKPKSYPWTKAPYKPVAQLFTSSSVLVNGVTNYLKIQIILLKLFGSVQ